MKKLFSILVVVLLAVALTGCQPDNNTTVAPTELKNQATIPANKKIAITIDKVNKDGLSLVKTQVNENFDESLPKTAMNALLSQDDSKESPNPLARAKVKLISLDIKGDLAIVNFSSEIKSIKGGSMDEMLMIGSIVNTLTEFKEIKKIQILVDGKRVETLLGHMDLSVPLERDESIMHKQSK